MIYRKWINVVKLLWGVVLELLKSTCHISKLYRMAISVFIGVNSINLGINSFLNIGIYLKNISKNKAENIIWIN